MISEVNNQGRLIGVPFSSQSEEGPSEKATRRKSGPKPKSLAQRFWSRVTKTQTCWLWAGGPCGSDGYGGIYVAHHQVPGAKYSKPSYAHRVSWELAFGPVPDGQSVLHSCDNRACVNPAHLFLGDQSANMKDAAGKGRLHAPRPTHPRRKLSDADVADLRAMRERGALLSEIATHYGVTVACVSRIVAGKARVYTAPQLRRIA